MERETETGRATWIGSGDEVRDRCRRVRPSLSPLSLSPYPIVRCGRCAGRRPLPRGFDAQQGRSWRQRLPFASRLSWLTCGGQRPRRVGPGAGGGGGGCGRCGLGSDRSCSGGERLPLRREAPGSCAARGLPCQQPPLPWPLARFGLPRRSLFDAAAAAGCQTRGRAHAPAGGRGSGGRPVGPAGRAMLPGQRTAAPPVASLPSALRARPAAAGPSLRQIKFHCSKASWPLEHGPPPRLLSPC